MLKITFPDTTVQIFVRPKEAEINFTFTFPGLPFSASFGFQQEIIESSPDVRRISDYD